MLSPPLAPDDGPIDLQQLQRMTLGDAGLTREVLEMFVAQAARLLRSLTMLPAETCQLAHTLTGSARAIGACRVAAIASALEFAVREGGDPSQVLRELDHAVTEACSAIEAMLRNS
jgi:HPt (histidine-containing phosphotransfer) domain-containing protein